MGSRDGADGGHPSGGKKKSDGGARTTITILLLGDDGVGKSSLISTFVSRHFSAEAVPGVMTRVRLPPDPASNSCITTIVDSRGADASLASAAVARGLAPADGSTASLTELGKAGAGKFGQQQRSEGFGGSSSYSSEQPEASTIGIGGASASSALAGGIGDVDCVVLVYDLDRVETFYRLENHWLPLIERCYSGQLPVIIAGNKMDLFSQSSTAAASDEQSLARSRQQIVSILQRFKFVRQCIKCSAKNLLNVDEVFLKAQQAVLYPITPLYDLDEGRIAPDCRRAFTRIFRMYDVDNDGLLSNAELNAFQNHAFNVPLVERDLTGWKKVVSKNNPTEQAVVRDGKFTVSGFLAIFDVFISQNRLEVPWRILRTFGYDDELKLDIPESVTSPPSGDSSSPSHPLWSLSPSARKFLTAMFHQFDTNGDGVLSTDDILAIFSVIPEPSLPPWHPLRARDVFRGCFSLPKIDLYDASSRSTSPSPPSTAVHTVSSSEPMPPLSASEITIMSAASLPSVDVSGGSPPESGSDHINSVMPRPLPFLDWMGYWHTIQAISPSSTRAELYRLGHVEAKATAEASRKKSSKRKAAVSPAADYSSILLPSKEIRAVVLGSRCCGKTALLSALCSTSKGSDISLERSPLETMKTPVPETSCTHVQLKTKLSPIGKKAGKDAAVIEDNREFVVHLVLTEVPQIRGKDGEQMMADVSSIIGRGSSGKMPNCDLVIFTFDCADLSSFAYVKELERTLLTDEVPRVYVGTKMDRLSVSIDGPHEPQQHSTIVEEDKTDGQTSTGEEMSTVDVARQHCADLDLEPPILSSATEAMLGGEGESAANHRADVLEHLARCALDGDAINQLRATPHAERKRREAARRKRMMWLGGILSVSVAVAVGVGAFWGSKKDGRKDRLYWLKHLFAFDDASSSTSTGVEANA